MRFGPKEKFWVVTDPTPVSVLGDILFAASLEDLRLQFLGGFSTEQNPTLFTDQAEATAEAMVRLQARQESATGRD